MTAIPVTELTRMINVLTRHWPGCLLGRQPGDGYHEVRRADGSLIVAHEGLRECVEAAVMLAKAGCA